MNGEMLSVRTTPVSCAEVEDAVAQDERALGAATGVWPRAAAALNLSISLQSRFRCERDLADVDRALAVLTDVVRDLDTGHPAEMMLEAQIMSCLTASNRLEDARRARDIGARLYPRTVHLGELRAGVATMLAVAAMNCFRHTSSAEDAEKSVDLMEEAVGDAPASSQARLLVQGALISALAVRYRTSPNREPDLDRAVEVFDALDPTGAGGDQHGVLRFAAAALVDSLIDRYERHHDPADMQTARRIQDDAPTGGGDGLPDSATAWDPQALRHYASFRQTQDANFLDQAIYEQDRAMHDPVRPPKQRATYAVILSICLFTRFLVHRGRRFADLNQAIDLIREARRDWRDTTLVQYSAQLLGRFLVQRHMAMGRPSDLREARVVLESALRTGDLEDRTKASILLQLAYCDGATAERNGDEEAADRALDRVAEVTRLVPEGSVEGLAFQVALASGLLGKAAATQLPADVARAYRASRAACLPAGAGPLATVPCAEDWGGLGWRREDYAEAAEAYTHVVTGLQTISVLHPRRENRQDWLGRAGLMAARAAFALARLGRAEEAVQVLETGRAVLLSEALDIQSADLDRLSAGGHAQLRERYERAAARGASAERAFEPDYETEYVPMLDPTMRDPELPLRELADNLGSAREELRRVLDEIRSVPGYETFLLPASFGDIHRIARTDRTPLVYLAATPRGGLALVVTASRTTPVEVVWLPELTVANERRWVARCLRAAEDDDLDGYEEASRWLGRAVMGPVLALLAPYRQAVLLPGGLLGSAPLHAAKLDDDAADSYALDRLTLVYAPSARAYAAAAGTGTDTDTITGLAATAHAATAHATTAGTSRSGDLLLAVADPASSGAVPLPGAQVETDIVAAHFSLESRLLRAGQATRARVLAAMSESDVLHFACHGVAEPMDPLSSRLLLVGAQTLTLRDINGLDRLSPRLTVLSACQTAVIGDELPDEAVSLATGLLQAGSPGVLATQWSVDDVASAALMARFYQLWRDEGVEPPAALRRAQLWVRRTTNGEKVRAFPDLLRIPDYGPPPEATPAVRHAWERRRAHEHPLYWAAFTFLGR